MVPMEKNVDLAEIAECIAGIGDADKLKAIVESAIRNGISIPEIVENGLRPGLEDVGRRYEAGEYFLSELVAAASLVEEVNQMIRPRLRVADASKKIGLIILGTVRGDIHDVGKSIFKMLAEAAGFEVIDLGVDVPPQEFLRHARDDEPAILALSALLTTSLASMRDSIDAVKQRDTGSVKVILGGNAVSQEFAKQSGADHGALNAVEGVRVCREWVTSE